MKPRIVFTIAKHKCVELLSNIDTVSIFTSMCCYVASQQLLLARALLQDDFE